MIENEQMEIEEHTKHLRRVRSGQSTALLPEALIREYGLEGMIGGLNQY